jgi:surface antigen
MQKFIRLALSAAAMLFAGAAAADPVRIAGSDEGYSRLARWEQHLDDAIADGVQHNTIDPRRAWQLQKRLDSVEARVVQSYYESNNGIDPQAFRRYASELRDISGQLGQGDWGSRNVYGNGWYDDRGPGWQGAGYAGAGGGYAGAGGGYAGGGGYPSGNYYRERDYERSCHQGNVAAGTIFGAVAGGLIGSAASHGNGAALAGGVVLGGLLGNTLSRDIACDDQRYAFDAYGHSMNGDVGRPYDWRHGNNNGTFTATREYRDGGMYCRDFRAVTYRDGQQYERDGTACRGPDGNWATR